MWRIRRALRGAATSLLRAVGNPEWSENWQAWPHCCGQAGCWMHYRAGDDELPAWCRCQCLWCKLARKVKPDYQGRV